jgi:hypothetical protein
MSPFWLCCLRPINLKRNSHPCCKVPANGAFQLHGHFVLQASLMPDLTLPLLFHVFYSTFRQDTRLHTIITFPRIPYPNDR